MLGYETPLFGAQHISEVVEAERVHNALTYEDETASGVWAFATLPSGRSLDKPTPLFKKLDDSVIAEELARLQSG
jgi:methionyl-tRNA synthetase